MTEATRREQIERALSVHAEDRDGERREFSLARGSTTLPVIRLPLTVPVLNTRSFRIAPALLDHHDAPMVAADPDSDDAQRVIADLVRSGHSNAVELRKSLQEEGQEEPGVITRSGILINANTRCVLMRDLLAEGKLRVNAIKVAVLPDDVTPAELFDLEAVLQKQADLKDPYDLVSELMMFKTLNIDGGMSEQQIAQRQRTTPAYVLQGFRILDLMERARHLQDPPIKIKEFGGARSQRENWKNLLLLVDKAESTGHKEAGDEVLRSFLALHILGADGVHGIRSLSADWINDHLLDALQGNGSIGEKIAEELRAIATAKAPASTHPLAGTSTQGRESDTDATDAALQAVTEPPARADHLDLLDFGSENEQPTTGSLATAFLDLTLTARSAGLGEVPLADGTTVPASDIISTLTGTSTAVLKDSENRLSAGRRYEAPGLLFEKASEVVEKANQALARVIDTPEFAVNADAVDTLLDQLSNQVKTARQTLRRINQR